MSAETGTDSSQIVNLSPEEKRVFGQLFRQADYDNVSVVTGEVAVSFFEKTRLDTRVLGQIWQIADTENRGFLTPAGFSVALRLIGHAQAGREPSPELARQSAPIPRFDGMTLPTPASPPPVPAALHAQGSGHSQSRIPPLTPDRVAQFAGLFERQNLAPGNLLPGDQAKAIFEKSGLPNETLGLVWQLADSDQRGAFLLHEFVIAMHLLNALKTGVLKTVPTSLPPGLVEAARRHPGPRQSPTHTGGMPAIHPQLSGSGNMRTGSPLARGAPGYPATGGDWAITPAEKTKFDSIYDTIDKSRRGFITGEEAVPFLSQSNLNGDMLAQIWDLADIKSEGQLNRDEFAVAMHLIRLQRARRDGTNILPKTLPSNLIPPSMRGQVRPLTAGSAFDSPPPQPQPQPPMPKSAVEDLWGLDSPAPPAQAPLPTGGSNASDPFGGSGPGSPTRASPPPSSKFQPFIPSSTFGKGLTQQATQESKSPHDGEDLLGDNDPEVSAKLTNESSELGNISNQIGTLTKQMTNLQTQRTTAQNDLTQANSQKKNFEQRLTQLRTMYEKEVKDVNALEEQLSASRSETRKLQAECMSLDGKYQDLRAQHQQVQSQLQADQQENAGLKEKIRALNSEIAQLRPQIEKMKSEARQQKGMVAINKKQLSTNEGERDKLKSEIDDLSKGGEELSRQATDTSQHSGSTPQVASPAASTTSATNPFFKRSASTDVVGAFPPQNAKGSDSLFDDIFGGPPPSTNTPPPPGPFSQPQHTGASTGSAGSMASPPTTSPVVSRQTTLSAEPAVPPPPESRQISSSFLPMKDVSESLSSSRQVSPPQSRIGDDKGTATPPIPSVGAFPSIDAASTSHSRAASPAETKPKVSGDLSNGSAATPDASEGTETAGATPTDQPAPAKSGPFGPVDDAQAKADFESAFASFKTNKSKDKPQGSESNAFSSFDTEFPPISELEREESDSDSERGAGFDDDFAPSSPKGADKGAGEKQTGAPAESKTEEPRDEKPVDTQAATNNSKPSNADDIFGSSLSTPTAAAPATQSSAPAPSSSKTPFDDDLDDDFEGLEDAKEGSADDDFANISKDDFNSVFDSPQPSQMKSESTYDFGTLSTGSLPNANANANAQAAAESNATPGPLPPVKADAGDWDAMFSELEPAGNGSPKEEERPGAKRADTGDDDPMLKQLVGMGYTRDQSVSALEKYDYNLERAANHLANQS